MPTDPVPAPDTAATPAESDIARIVGEEVNRQFKGRLKSELASAVSTAFAGALPALLEQLKAKPTDSPAASTGNPAPDGNAAEKLNMKALNEQLAALNARLAASEKAREASAAEAREATLGSKVREMFSKHLGADNPITGPLYDSMHRVGKRFDLDEGGNVVVKFRRGNGSDAYDEALPMDQGFKELLASDLKPYIQARAAGLPSAGGNGRGSAIRQPTAPAGMPFFMQEFVSEVSKDRPEVASALIEQSAAAQRR